VLGVIAACRARMIAVSDYTYGFHSSLPFFVFFVLFVLSVKGVASWSSFFQLKGTQKRSTM
jgi:hypothetical protein